MHLPTNMYILQKHQDCRERERERERERDRDRDRDRDRGLF